MSDASLRAWALLARCPSLTADEVAPALAAGASIDDVCERVARGELAARGARLRALPAQLAEAETQVDADLRWLESPGRALVHCAHPAYPPLLRATPDAPLALWLDGDAATLAAPQLAIVGSRTPTPTGRELAHDWAVAFARAGLTVTSGLATGIDACAHRGALAGGGRTLAVCGTGLDLVYPREHAALAREIATRGALVSEFPPGTPGRAANFPRRNRIISGLALGTLVVEAASRSGSLITARLAAEQGREVYAIPGSVLNPLARGCHRLLRQGARLVETAEEVLEDLANSPLASVLARADISAARADRSVPARPDSLDKGSEMLLDALGFEPLDVDTLVDRTGFPAQIVASMLLILELEGRVEPRAGRFCRVGPRRSSPVS